MKKFLIVIIMLASFSASVAAQEACGEHLFYISKSDNKNVMYYDANLTAEGKFDTETPIDIYWILGKDSSRHEMSILEKPHFGINLQTIEEGKSYKFVIKALKKKDIYAYFRGNCTVAVAELSGVASYVKDVFVYINPKSGLIPDVEYLDINGISVDGKATPTTERVYN
jgi:hypothetical protein